jgi:hypothetical protein
MSEPDSVALDVARELDQERKDIAIIPSHP